MEAPCRSYYNNVSVSTRGAPLGPRTSAKQYVVQQRGWYKAVKASSAVRIWAGPFYDAQTNSLIVTAQEKILTESGQFIGAACVQVGRLASSSVFPRFNPTPAACTSLTCTCDLTASLCARFT